VAQSLHSPAPGNARARIISLAEFEPAEAELPWDAYRALRDRYGKYVAVAPSEQAGRYVVTARDHVGRVGLPGGVVVSIRPKAPVANLFYMLCSGPGAAHFRPPPMGMAPSSDVYQFVLAALLGAVERLVSAGLYRDYRPRHDRLPYVRGRIEIAPQIREAGLHHRHACLYADLTADTPENRVLAAALRYVPTLLDGGVEAVLSRRARALLAYFGAVRPVSRAGALELVRGINIHRLNAEYGPALALARLALNRLSLDERPGPHPFASFMVDMPRLFESFLTERLRALLPRHGLRVVAQRHDYLDEDRTVGIRPDVLVYAHRGALPVLVLDAKYRRAGGPDEEGLNRDLYQVSAYLDRYGLRHGVLVYPRFGDETPSRLRLRGTPKSLHIATLDLASPTTGELEWECEALAGQVAALALDGP
jgi:5-methylcytosine-specific restriction enzyme subunit McrC